MEFSIDTNNVLLEQQNQVESGEYNVTECNFIFSSEYEGLTKKAVFTGEDGIAYLQTIVDNKCSIPSEILATSQVVQIGVYAYDVDNEELLLRYSPRPTEFYVHEGSYKEGQNSTPPTPSEIEQLQSQITSNANNIEELQECCGKYDSDIADLKAEQITQNNNIQTNANNISTITENITIINEALGTINENIGDLQEGQIEQNINIQKNADDIIEINQDINEIDSSINAINQNIDDLEQDLTNYSLITETGSQINLNINSSNFQMTAILKDKNGNVIHTSNVIDLPLETMVVGASYDNVTKEVVLKLQNGTTVRFSVADLVSGLVSTDQLTQILSNYYNKNEVDALIPDLTDYVKNTDYATSSKGGVVKAVSSNGFGMSAAGNLYATTRTYTQYTGDGEAVNISKGTLENVITGKELINQTQLEESQAIQDTEIETLQNKVTELEENNENLLNLLPSVSGEGEDIILEGTAKYKFKKLELGGNTKQTQLTGKNLANVPENWSFERYVVIPIELEAGDYIISIKSGTNDGSTNSNIKLADDNNTQLANFSIAQNTGVKTETVTLTSNATKLMCYSQYNYASGTGITATINQFMIRKANVTDDTYEPYCGGIPSPNPDFPQQIKNVTGQANVKIQNKNLLNIPNATGQKNNIDYTVANQTITLNGTNRSGTYSWIIITKDSFIFNNGTPSANQIVNWANGELLAIGQVVKSVQILSGSSTRSSFSPNLYDENGNSISTFTETTKISALAMYLGSSDTYTNFKFGLQLELGSTATSYVEHQEQNYPFTFSEGQRAMQGTTLEDDGIHQKHKQIALDGAETFWNITMAEDIPCFWFRNSNIGAKNNPHNKKCNYFIYSSLGYRSAEINTLCENESAIPLFIFKTNIANSIETWKQWLAEQYANGTPVIVEYELEEEEIIPYNETQQAQYNEIKEAISYYEQTNISGSSDELSPIITASAVGDLNLILDTMQSKIDLLEG